MNIISTIIGLSIMGVAAPSMVNMSIAPIQAQKRAENFAVAEATAVTFAAQAESSQSVSSVPDGCGLNNLGNAVYTVTCAHGEGAYRQEVSRTLRLDISSTGETGRTFAYDTPQKYSQHMCPVTDQWGVQGYNDTWAESLGGWCIPYPAWTKGWYEASNPDDWMYDINNYNGWGRHPDY